ncbi:hypothetical protein JB92DRAFT_3116146 [Gautieria morchelliformis]|nr:hypothetical protein JB92DRAFT_3116146 [Gautieria morchelliformis]
MAFGLGLGDGVTASQTFQQPHYHQCGRQSTALLFQQACVAPGRVNLTSIVAPFLLTPLAPTLPTPSHVPVPLAHIPIVMILLHPISFPRFPLHPSPTTRATPEPGPPSVNSISSTPAPAPTPIPSPLPPGYPSMPPEVLHQPQHERCAIPTTS